MDPFTARRRYEQAPFPSLPKAEETRYRIDLKEEYGPFTIIEAYDEQPKRVRIFAFVREGEKFEGGQVPHSVMRAIGQAEKEWGAKGFNIVTENLIFSDHRGRDPYGSRHRYYLNGVIDRIE